MTFTNWKKFVKGKKIDYDGVYNNQCVDLIKHYIKNVLEFTPQSIGNAIDYYNKRNNSYLKKNFKFIKNYPAFVPARGDIAIFKSSSGNGHVSICTGVGTTTWFKSYDQNYPHGKGESIGEFTHDYKKFIGVLRPLNRKNLK